MWNLGDILPLFCTPTWLSHHMHENQELYDSNTIIPPLYLSGLTTYQLNPRIVLQEIISEAHLFQRCGNIFLWDHYKIKADSFQILIIGLEQMLFYQERKCGRYELLLLLLPQAFWRGSQKAKRHPSDFQVEILLLDLRCFTQPCHLSVNDKKKQLKCFNIYRLLPKIKIQEQLCHF